MIGAQTEPDARLDLSPGATLGVGPPATRHADVQVPGYQKVRDIEMVSRASFVLGLTSDF